LIAKDNNKVIQVPNRSHKEHSMYSILDVIQDGQVYEYIKRRSQTFSPTQEKPQVSQDQLSDDNDDDRQDYAGHINFNDLQDEETTHSVFCIRK